MDAENFQQLIHPVQDKLYRFALSILGHDSDAQDVVQDVILKLWDKREQLEQIENPEAWLMTATKNKCIDLLRSKKRSTSSLDDALELPSTQLSPEAVTISSDLMEIIRSMMAELPEAQQAVMVLRDIEGYTYEEIAEMTELSLSQVKINLHRARKKLKENLIKANIHGIG